MKPVAADHTRDIVLKKAGEMFLTLGYHGTSMRNVAQASGISTGPLYFHFQNKAEIFFHICLKGYSRLLADFQEAAAENDSAAVRLQRVLYAYWYFFHSEPELYQILKLTDNPSAGVELPEPLLQELKAKRQEVLDVMEEVTRSGIAAGELRKLDPKAFALFLYSLADGIFQSYRGGLIQDAALSFDQVIITAVQIIANGMLADE